MKASVVIPVYNTGFLLRRMLDSVLAQTEKDIELICVDDGSTDGSDRVVEEYAARDGRVRLIRQKNQGPYVARSTGIMAAQGEYVYICDHDDRMHPQLIEFCLHELKRYDTQIIVFGHDNRTEQGDFEMPPLPDFDSIEVRVLDDSVLRKDRARYLSALAEVHIDQWAHVAKRELAQSVLCQSDYNLPRTLNLIKRTGRWLWTPLKLYYYNTGNPGSLIKKPPTFKNISDTHSDLIGLLDLFRDERNSGDTNLVWATVCHVFLIPNVKILYNMLRRTRKALRRSGRLHESFRRFSILLHDVFVLRGVPVSLCKFRHRWMYRWLMFRYRPDLMQTREALSARILYNKSHFEELTAKLSELESDDDIISGSRRALGFQMNHATCYYSSPAIEEALQKVARRHSVPLAEKYARGSVLHVMTLYLSAGGHTRVVERWIARSPAEERHSVVVLSRPKAPPPETLMKNVNAHNGEIVFLDQPSPLERALKLRELASSFERIVLHVNSDDIVPLLAFGTEEFKRPVFLFNHADHIFGLGASIADAFIDLRTGGAEISKAYRGVRNSHLLNLPFDDNSDANQLDETGKDSLREKLGLPSDRKIIVSAASAYKYKPFLEWNFVSYMQAVLEKHKDVEFVIIGPKELKGRFGFRDRVRVLGMVKPQTLMQYYRVADLVVDSFPFMSFLSLQDAISAGAVVLSLKSVMGHMDSVERSKAYVSGLQELVEDTSRMLSDANYAKAVMDDVERRLSEEKDPVKWLCRLQDISKSATTHHVQGFTSTPYDAPPTIDMFIESQRLHLKTKLNMLGLLSVVSYRRDGRKVHGLMFLPGRDSAGQLQ